MHKTLLLDVRDIQFHSLERDEQPKTQAWQCGCTMMSFLAMSEADLNKLSTRAQSAFSSGLMPAGIGKVESVNASGLASLHLQVEHEHAFDSLHASSKIYEII